MFTVFVSHQWLSFHHPDPGGERLQVLQETLKNLISKRLTIENDIVSQFNGVRLTAKQLEGVGQWHMWLDYFCVPQLLNGEQGPALAGDQLLYVNSIPSYVDLCDVFVALVPRTWHIDKREGCDFHSWLQRGWCRTEVWCYFLSTRPKIPIIVVKGADAAHFTVPLWHQYPVHQGDFALELDRASCCSIIQAALAKHVSKLRQTQSTTTYRFYLALSEEMTGLPTKQRSVDDFLSEFGFLEPLQQYRGFGPVACAALSGDSVLIRDLAIHKACLHTRAPGIPALRSIPDLTPVHLAAWLGSHDALVLETLLELRADPHSSTVNVPPPLGFCRTVRATELLIQHGADVNRQGKSFSQFCPIHIATALGAPSEVISRLLELRADVQGGMGRIASASPLHTIALNGDSPNDLRTAQLLVESRADVNQIPRLEGAWRILELIFRACDRCSSEPTILLRFLSNCSATPLGWCVVSDNEGLLVFLLRARADPEVRNYRGLRPIDIARSERIRAIIRNPALHMCLLESDSELVTEIF